MTVKFRLMLIAIVPLFALIFLTTINSISSLKTKNQAKNVETTSQTAIVFSNLVHELQKERGASFGYISSNASSFTKELPQFQQSTDKAVQTYKENKEQLGKSTPDLSHVDNFISQLSQLRNQVNSVQVSGPSMAMQYTQAINHLIDSAETLVAQNNLGETLTYSNAYFSIMRAKENAGLERAVGAVGFAEGEFDTNRFQLFIELAANQEIFIAQAQKAASQQDLIAIEEMQNSTANSRLKIIRDIVISAEIEGDVSSIEAPHWFKASTNRIDELKALENQLGTTLQSSALSMAKNETRNVMMFIGLSVLTILLAGAYALATANNISKPLSGLTESMREIAKGNFSNATGNKDRKDIIGEMSKTLDQFRMDLGNSVEANTTAMFKGTAFDNSSMAMMLIDDDLVVTYVNKSTMELFANHAEEFKEAFPDFNSENIIGTCIDIFHKHPEHQRALLAEPTKLPFRTDISIGELKFALSASMVTDANGNRVGNALEWDHVTQSRTNAGLIDSLDRDHALIEFNLDGSIITANEQFLSITGYSLSEIVGKHHNIFVSPEFSASAQYDRFWEKLNDGQSMSSKDEQTGKEGQSIWFDASYISVMDGNGKPFKVVKIATDVTNDAVERIESEKAAAKLAKKQADTVIDTLASSLKAMAGGNLDSTISQTFHGDYDQLRINFNAAIDKLRNTMRTISVNAVSIQTGAVEMSQASEDLSTRTETQAAALEQTAAALDEITATVQQTAKSSELANDVADSAREGAEKSGEVVREAVQAMGAIKDSSNEISKIIGVIDEIAFQTNLLALNAGVEAARAGEAGRGFAVVASEVRALAQRSSEAAKDIKNLISASSKHVESGVTLVDQTGTSLLEIVKNVVEVSTLISGISSSAQEQATGLSELNSAVNDMDQVTQQNAAMTEESTAACHSLTNESDEMTRLISQFNVGGSDKNSNVRSIKGADVTAPAKRPVVNSQQDRAAAFFAASQGSAALEMDSEEDNDWQDF